MPVLQTEALILRTVPFGESDRVVHLLIPEIGRLSAIARSARRSVKRFGGTLDLFNLLRIQLARPGSGRMRRLEQSRLIRHFDPLRADSARFALGCYLLELLDRLAPEGGNPSDMRRLFAFSLAALEQIATRPPEPRLRMLLELHALDALGLRPELRRCVRCGAEAGSRGAVDFHVAEGGPACEACAASLDGLLPIHLGTLRTLERALQLGLPQLDRLMLSGLALEEARCLVSRFQRFHLGVELRSAAFVDEMLSRTVAHPAAGT